MTTASIPKGSPRSRAALREVGEIYTVAPDRAQSSMSHALTLHRPLRVQELAPRRLAVDGTPVDCVKLSLTGLLPVRPDLVISGINKGPNLGDDIIYSGTVSAAIEGALLGIPAIAVSLVTFKNFDFRAAAEFTADSGRAHRRTRHSAENAAQRQRSARFQKQHQRLAPDAHGQTPLQRNHRRTSRSARRQILLDWRRRSGIRRRGRNRLQSRAAKAIFQ